MKLMIIWGSSRTGRKGGKVVDWVKKKAEEDSRYELDFVDLKELNLPFFDEPANPFNFESSADYTNPEGKKWAERVDEADAFIFITPEYNYSTSAVLKNAMDWVGKPWVDKPVGFVGYGGIVGGARAVEQLRTMVVEMGLIQLPSSLYFPYFGEAFDETGQPKRLDYYEANIKKMFDNLARISKVFS